MATATGPEDAPSAAGGAKGEANRKRGSEQGEGGAGGRQKRKKKEVFIYGNYRNYYGYRVSAKPPLLSPSHPGIHGPFLFTLDRQLFDGVPHRLVGFGCFSFKIRIQNRVNVA
jgi:hypothetical protein